MKKRYVLLFLILTTLTAWAQPTPDVSLTIAETAAQPGDTVCLSISIQQFNDVQGMQWGLRWNAQDLEFLRLGNLNLPDLSTSDFNVGGAPEGFFLLSWIPLREPFTISLPDDTQIMEVCFRVRENARGGYTTVAFDNDVLTSEIYVDGNLYDAPIVRRPGMHSGGIRINRTGDLRLNAEVDNNITCGAENGNITATPLTGQGPYAYQWQGPDGFVAETSALEGLPAGRYDLTVTDQSGTQGFGYFLISVHGDPDDLPNFILGASVQDTECGEATGRIDVVLDSGNAYDLEWNTGDTTTRIDGLAAGTYQLEVRNDRGCLQNYTYTVNSTDQLNGLTQVTDSLTCTNPEALIGVVADPGSNFSYHWNTGDSTNLLTAVNPGQYQLTVTDVANCSEVFTYFLPRAQISASFTRIDGNLGCTDSVTQIGITDITDGEDLDLSWEDGSSAPLRSVSDVGTYTLSLSEGSCNNTLTFRVEQNLEGQFIYQPVNQPLTCAGDSARIGVTASPELDYTYFWSGRSETTPILEVTTPGLYELNIENGRCVQTEVFEVQPLSVPDFTFARTFNEDLTCDPADSARIGFLPLPNSTYQFQWDTGSDSPELRVDAPGNFSVTVTEGICQDSFTYTVDLVAERNYRRISQALTCVDTAVLVGIADAPDYFEYTWSNGLRSAQIPVSTPGTFELTISSADRCNFTESFSVIRDTDPTAYQRLEDTLDCSGTDTARIGMVPALDFAQDLSFAWNTGVEDTLLAVTSPGLYTLTITGTAGCRETYSFSVSDQSESLSYERVDDALSCADPEATVGIIASDSLNYTFSWSNGRTTPTVDLTLPGVYQVTITDPTNQCSRIEDFTLDPPSIRDAELSASCFTGDLCGSLITLTATVNDGRPPFQYAWSTGQMDTLTGPGVLTLERPQTISVTVTDASGCTVERSLTPEACLPLNEFTGRLYFDCSEGDGPGIIYAEVVTGGVPPFVYTWNTGQTDTSYFRSGTTFDPGVGTYSVTVTDDLGQSQTVRLQETELYGCGVADENLTFLAPHITVSPGSTFRYPVRATQLTNIDRSVYTIDWDPCLLRADSIFLYSPTDTLIFTDLNPLQSTYEVSVVNLDQNNLADTLIIGEIVFTARGEGVSPFLFTVNEPATNTRGDAVPVRPQHGSITVAGSEDLVLAGDADRDGAIDHYDALAIGLGYGDRGPDRRRALRRGEEFAYHWNSSTPQSQINYRYLDADGNGQIGEEDLDVILDNWTPTQRPPVSIPPNSPRLFITGDTLKPGSPNTLAIHLGTSDLPISEAYGLAFTLDYSQLDILPGVNINLDLEEGWLQQEDYTYLVKQEREEQKLYIAITGINGENRSGSGQIIQFFVWLDEQTGQQAELFLSEARLIDAEENILPLITESTTLVIDQVTGQRNPALDQRIRLFPNPTSEATQIAAEGLTIEEVVVRNVQGQLVRRQDANPKMTIAGLSPGVYVLQIRTDQGMAVRRLMVVRP